MYYVYVLISKSAGKRYIGQTENLDRRIDQHDPSDHKLAITWSIAV